MKEVGKECTKLLEEFSSLILFSLCILRHVEHWAGLGSLAILYKQFLYYISQYVDCCLPKKPNSHPLCPQTFVKPISLVG